MNNTVFYKDFIPVIQLPFPPSFNIDDYLNLKNPDDKSSLKTPNSFIIYHTIYQKELKKRGIILPMANASIIISERWNKEPEMIKNEYRKLQKEIRIRFDEKFPKRKCNVNTIKLEPIENYEINYKENIYMIHVKLCGYYDFLYSDSNI
ncbi:6320_t:CDS:2 [Scutellospora calospora]|uniref:6320_t:CDS:1 n=1 Tax=Scutellospora calospora TaxID=85575 RepID=A0ACA9K8N2_9GLOM|nr:6320_t:CDS:2 [Scutellospora calospora]